MRRGQTVHLLTYDALPVVGGVSTAAGCRAASLAFAIGVTDEAMQSYPGRHADRRSWRRSCRRIAGDGAASAAVALWTDRLISCLAAR